MGMTTNKTHKCYWCQKEAEFLATTDWQDGDTDTFGMDDADLVADGARWLCIECLNLEEAGEL